MTKQQILGEIEEVLRAMPSLGDMTENAEAHVAWIGRSSAALRRWNSDRVLLDLVQLPKDLQSVNPGVYRAAYTMLAALIHEARADLRMELDQGSVLVPTGHVFDYFDEVRKIIEAARSELFFVDRYLGPAFVSRFLPNVVRGTRVRLLASHKSMAALVPAVDLFATQAGCTVQVRASDQFHDRFVFVDGRECYFSGASFKDGAVNAPTLLTQVTDAYHALSHTYEGLWTAATSHR